MSSVNQIPLESRNKLQIWMDNPEVSAFLQARNWKEAFARYTYLEIGQEPPFARLTKPLRNATIMAITSGGLYVDGAQPPFHAADVYGDPSIRLIPIDTPRSRLRIAHDHYDHTVPEQDMHTINPVDHLKALREEGFIGSVYPAEISFSGYIPVWTRVLDQLIPAVLDQIRGKPIDAALLVPV